MSSFEPSLFGYLEADYLASLQPPQAAAAAAKPQHVQNIEKVSSEKFHDMNDSSKRDSNLNKKRKFDSTNTKDTDSKRQKKEIRYMQSITANLKALRNSKIDYEKKLEKIDKLFSEMRERNLTPNEYTYTAIMSINGQHGDEKRLLRNYNLMKVNRLMFSTFIFTPIFNYYIRIKNCEKLMYFIDEMKKSRIKLNEILAIKCTVFVINEGNLHAAISLLTNMLEDKLDPTNFFLVGVFELCLKMGTPFEMDKVLGLLKEARFKFNASDYKSLIIFYAKHKKPDKVHDLLCEVRNNRKTLTKNDYLDILNICIDNKWRLVTAIEQMMFETECFDDEIFMILLIFYLEMNQEQQALDMFSYRDGLKEKQQVDVLAFRAVMVFYAAGKFSKNSDKISILNGIQLNKVFTWLEERKKILGHLTIKKEDYEALINCCLLNNHGQAAIRFFNLMTEDRLLISPDLYNRLPGQWGHK